MIAGILFYIIWGGMIGWEILVDGLSWEWTDQNLAFAALIIPAAYAFTGLQSIGYVAVMEWRFARGLDPGSWRAVHLSAGLGCLSAMVPYAVLLFDAPGGNRVTGGFALGGLGCAVGFLLGLLIKVRSADQSKPTVASER
jgi:hypothetical protein